MPAVVGQKRNIVADGARGDPEVVVRCDAVAALRSLGLGLEISVCLANRKVNSD